MAFDKKIESSIEWSTGIDLSSDYDTFVSIPSFGDVKVHIEHVGFTCHMYLDPVGRAEVSAREIRSRIKGGKQITTTVVQMTSVDSKIFSLGDDVDLSLKNASPVPLAINIDSSPTYSPGAIPVQSPMSKGAAQLLTNWQALTPRLAIEAGFVCKHLRIVIEDCLIDHSIIQEVLSLSLDTLVISYHPSGLVDRLAMRRQHDISSLNIAICGMQIDNQLHDTGCYDFPVLLLSTPQQPKENMTGPPQHIKPKSVFLCSVSELKNKFVGSEQAMLLLCSQLCYDAEICNTVLQTLDLTISPLSVNVEDSFVYYMLKITDTFVPTLLHSPKAKRRATPHQLPSEVAISSSIVCQPVRLQSINISSLSILLSVHASLKLFISSDHSPLSFVAFTRSGLVSSNSHLTRALIMHYASGALFRAGK